MSSIKTLSIDIKTSLTLVNLQSKGVRKLRGQLIVLIYIYYIIQRETSRQ